MYIAMGDQDPASLRKPERRLLDDRVELVVGDGHATSTRRPAQVGPRRRHPARLRRAHHRHRLAHPAREHRALRGGGAPLLQRGGRPAPAPGARRLQGGKVVVGIASMPYKCPPAPLEVTFLIEAELRERGLRETQRGPLLLAHRPRLHHRVGQRDGHRRAREEGHRAAHLLQRRGHRSGAQGRPQPRGRGARLRPARAGASAQGGPGASSTAASRRRPAAGCRPIPRPSTWAVASTSGPSATPPTCRSARPAPRRTSRRRSSPSGWPRAIQGREPHARDAIYTGKVMCFFEVGDGTGTLLRFDYEHPPDPPASQPPLAPGQGLLQQDLLPHRPAGSRRHDREAPLAGEVGEDLHARGHHRLVQGWVRSPSGARERHRGPARPARPPRAPAPRPR